MILLWKLIDLFIQLVNSAKMGADKPKILIVGLGGVGVIAAYALQYGEKAEVTALIRSDYDRVIEKGYEINSCDYGHIEGFRPTHVVKTIEDAKKYGEFDFILVTTKNLPDITTVEDVFADAVTEKTTIVLLQNGFGIEKTTLKRFPGHFILSGVSMISSANFHGVVEHVGTDSLKLGYFDNGVNTTEEQIAKAKEFIELYDNEKIDCHYDEDVKFSRWRKLIYNASFNTIGALVDLDVGRIHEAGGIETLIKPAMREIIKVAASDGVTLPESIMDAMIHSDDGVWYAPSMVVDVRKGNQIELEVILGNVVDVAKENNVDIPVLYTIYNLLHLVQFRLKEKNGYVVLPKERPLKVKPDSSD